MRIGWGVGISSVVVTLLFACGGTSSSGSGGGAVPEDSFASSYCNAYTACCQKIGKTGDTSTCQALFNSRGSDQQYNATLGGKCLSEISAAQSKPTFCDMNPTDTPSCDGVYTQNGSSTGTKA